MQAASSAPPSPPASAPPAPERVRRGPIERARRYLFGHDVFISYARADALDYARGLTDALRRRGLDAYIDQLGTPPGSTKLPALLFARLRRSSMMVLVASPAAARSWAVAEEVKAFMRWSHNLFVVDVAGALDEVDWYREIQGSVPRKITPAELASGEPSPTIVDQIVKSASFTRLEDRRRKVAVRSVTLFAALLLALIAGSWIATNRLTSLRKETNRQTLFAAQESRRATDAGQRADSLNEVAATAEDAARTAEAEKKVAEDSAASARADAVQARSDATLAEEEARTATDSVEARRRTARALELANRATAAIDHTGDGLARGALLSLESLEVEWTVEGMSAWMRAMTLIPPRLHLRQAHDDEVTALAASADGRRLASGAGDGRVRVWDVRTEPDPLRRMRVSTDSAEVGELAVPRGTVYTLALSADGRRLAAGSRGRRLRVWDLETGEMRDLSLGRGDGFVRAAAFSPDGQWLAAAVGDSAAWLFDTRDGSSVRVGEGNADVAAVAFSRDGRWLMIGGRTLDTWNVASGRLAAREDLPRMSASVTALAFSRDGSTLALASRRGIDLRQVEGEKGGTLALAPFRALVTAPNARGAQDANASLAFSRDGRQLAYARRNEWTARVVEVRSGDETSRMVEAAGGVAFGAGWVATGHADGTVAFWPADGAKEVMRIRHPGAVLAASFSPDGRWLASSAGDAKVRIFGARTLDTVRTVSLASPAAVVGFSPGARRLVAAREGALDVVESGSWRPAYPPRRLEGKPRALAFSPDGGMVAAWYARACARATVELRVWNLAGGNELAGDWPGCTTSDGRASPARRAGSAALLRAAEAWPRIRHGEEWTSPDGRWSVATPDPLAVLGEAATGREVARLTHGGDVEGLAFSPDRTWLATASRDRTLRLWLFGDPERMIAEACARLPLRLREQSRTRAPRNLCAERHRADP